MARVTQPFTGRTANFEAARTIRRHWQAILSWFDGHLNNGGVEGTNSMIQAAKARARGYGTVRHLITMAYLVAGNSRTFRLPPSSQVVVLENEQ